MTVQSLPKDLGILTSMRFFAAYWVVLFHLGSFRKFDDGTLSTFAANGPRAVDFFFILSGFIIFHVYGKAIEDKTFRFRSYMVRRFNRLYPVHIATLICAFVMGYAKSQFGEYSVYQFEVSELLSTLVLLHAFSTTDGLVFNGQSWSISAEFFAYLLFGLAASLIAIRQKTIVTAATFIAAAGGAHLFAQQLGKPSFMHMTWDFGAIRIVPLFILGIFLRQLTEKLGAAWATPLLAIGVVSLAFFAMQANAGYEILVPFCLLIIGGAIASAREHAPLNDRVSKYLGEISYSTYMVHIFCIQIVVELFPRLLPQSVLTTDLEYLAAITVLVIIASAISYHVVEVPARNFLNRKFS